jgi:integrase
MAERLTDGVVRDLAAPASGNKITYDDDVKGFGVRITTAGAKAFVLNYRAAGRERRITIGSFPDWTVKAAREHAKGLKRQIDVGEDPMAERHDQRAEKTIDHLCDIFETEHLPSRRASTREDYVSLIRLYVRPRLGKMKMSAVRHSDIAALHREIAKRAPYRANRLHAVLSTMMGVAIKEGWREDNPCQGVEKAHEEKRERFLSPAEIARLADALAAHTEKVSANAIRLLMLTGARRGEALAMEWGQVDLASGVWTKPSAHTKQRKVHRVPLSAPALQLLSGIKETADPECPYVFPSVKTSHPGKGAAGYQHLVEIKRTWSSVCAAAKLSGVRLHDLRHSFASVLVSSGLSLPIIGALLGHTQSSTTHRYAHLADDPLRAATERAGAIISGAGAGRAEIVPIQGGRATSR